MKLAPVAVLLLLVVAAVPAGANPEYPKVGFEIEIGKIYVVRYDGSDFTNIYEKTRGSYLAETRGIVADNPSKTWPLLQLTADNVKRPTNLRVKLHEGLDNPAGETISKPTSYRGVLEIVTGPLLHQKPLQTDVVNAARLFVTTFYDFCAKGGQSDSHYYAVSALIDEYNKRLRANTYTTTLDKRLLELELVDPNTAYLSCPGPEYTKPIENANLRIDVQATFGTPLRFLDDSGSGIATWPQPNANDFGRLRTLVENSNLPAVRQKEFMGLVRLWYPLMLCALRPNEDGEEGALPLAICNKNFARPLPRIDVCKLSNRFWDGVPQAGRGAARTAFEPPLLAMAQRLTSLGTANPLQKLGLPPADKTRKTTAEIRREDEVWRMMAGAVLRGTDACIQILEQRNGNYLAYGDGTTIPVLDLKLSDNENLLGFGLEIRTSAALSSRFHTPDALVAEVDEQLGRYFGSEAARMLSGPENPPMPRLRGE